MPEKSGNALHPVSNNERAQNCRRVTEIALNLRLENQNLEFTGINGEKYVPEDIWQRMVVKLLLQCIVCLMSSQIHLQWACVLGNTRANNSIKFEAVSYLRNLEMAAERE